jgi:pimeloyl-ACP methyl ester carboxylesterase
VIVWSLAIFAAGIGFLALASLIGARAIAARFPPAGQFMRVADGRLHVLDLGPRAAALPPVVLVHGASGNLNEMRRALGDRLARDRRVVMIDRPGHGWSERVGGPDAATPTRQAAILAQAIGQLGLDRPVLVAHSMAGALATALALDFPDAISGLVLVSPVTHPWPGGISWYYTLAATPLIGSLFANTVAVPGGLLSLKGGIASVFAPHPVPDDYEDRAAIPLVLRPQVFADNARDVAALYAHVAARQSRYGEIRHPVSIVAGDIDTVVSTDIHARAFARAVPQTRLVVLPQTGHAPHHVAPQVVLDEIARVSAAARD